VSNFTNRDEKDELTKFMAGDDKAFSELVNRYKERIFLVVLRIVRNREEAKDLAQEAFVKAYHSRQSFRAESGFYTWVYRIAVNLSLNYINRNRDRQAESIDDITPAAKGSFANADLENEELRLVIDEAIKRLPARQRIVFVLRHYEEKSHAEIGETLSITEGAVKANYHQAIQKLKEYLGVYLKEGRLSV
jgi:RNA polymerase sigma-70 factor (ECF subfamily)